MNANRSAASHELLAARDRIAALLFENVPTMERTLIVRLLARSLADEYSGSVVEGRAPSLVAWAEEMCAKPGRSRAVAALFSAAQAIASPLADSGLPERFLTSLPSLADAALSVAIAESERARHTNHFDEVDAAIAELLVHVGASDPSAAVHARDVSSWCARLARQLALPVSEISFVRRCGLLHDQAGPSSALFASFLDVARTALEPLDDETPMAARIVAVACRFSAAITGSDGRGAMTPANALAEVVAGAGSRYDVSVVAALRELIERR
jgi:HD-GYP domain-containing protein (c-di-GMP phosphodiesterase class II)